MSQPTDNLPLRRTRLAVGLVALGAVALELAMMRTLSLRFWSHFAYMVISVAILGFGAAGTAMTLLRRRIVPAKRTWMFHLALALALSVPLIGLAGRSLPVDVQFLAWDLWQIGYVAALELLMFVPFLLAGTFLGIAMMDAPARISGHYAANLAGSGAGAAAGVALMYVLSPAGLAVACGVAALLAAIVLLPRRLSAAVATAIAAAGMVLLVPSALGDPAMSPYKMLPQVQAMPGTETLYQAEGPLGRIDVVAGPAVHFGPGLSLQYTGWVPPQALLIVDGDSTSPIYDCKAKEDWAFADQTTPAVAYHLRTRPSVCVLGAGGGADIGLAIYHDASKVVALEMNRQIIQAMADPLASRGGDVYCRPGVTVLARDAREYLASTPEKFDIIQFPAIDAFGASGAGLYATQESYLYTVEALALMMDRLSDDGIIAVTRWARIPPRDELKVFHTAAEMLRSRQVDPAQHLAMIRNWATVTVLISKPPLSQQDTDRIGAFCNARSFDLCYLPGLTEQETNRFHILDRPYYFEGCRAIFGQERQAYLDGYLFRIDAASDDKPYFFHFLRWRTLSILHEQIGRRSRAFAEIGYLMLIAALVQAAAMAAAMIILPLAPGVRAIRGEPRKAATFGYFLMIGIGFMLLEMAFLQKLILYLGHPIYSAAAVITGFLVFAGLGSQASQYWPIRSRRLGLAAGSAVAVLGLAYLVTMDYWLTPAWGLTMAGRFAIAVATIAPLAFAMGHMLPTGMRLVSRAAPALVPWAWAINGLASVVATVAAPLLAMQVGFALVMLLAVGCYLAAGALSLALPQTR